ncbi:endoglucanase [Sorangium cellulosum]|uniref:Beta-xylanase n=1 Tax=Sorangium cellulosum TaxID=56 RepID=A0A2L0F4N8_SORCE|nr:endo-1,4-beta-xylanase [Sorangium cellulosum]AUX46535.1 endoglucanase [Sorangium cellulosum]
MNKIRSSRWLCGTTWIALGVAALFGCSGGEDGGGGGEGGAGSGGSGTSSTTTSGPGPGSTGTTSTTSTSAGPGPTTSSTSSGSNEGGGGSSSGTGGAAPSEEKFVGNITTSGAVREGFARYWNQITPENEGKWASVERSRGNRDWSKLDAIYRYAQENNLIFKHHVFVWGSQQPDWIANLSAADQRQAVRDWMQAFCERYPDTKYIDVVNEPPPHTTPSYKAGLGGDGASGWDWIVNSFKWAREFCPNAVLILNDYNNIEYQGEHNHFKEIARKVIEAGAPVDAIGAQAHDAFKINTTQVKGFIDSLASLGKPVYITEYDIGIQNDEEQRRVMEEQFTMFWNHPAVPGITLWGYIVGATWRDNTGIQHANGTMRPAMSWLMEFLGRE